MLAHALHRVAGGTIDVVLSYLEAGRAVRAVHVALVMQTLLVVTRPPAHWI
jgi:hypothetical protein